MYVLRETAKTPASRALLRAAAQALEEASRERRTAMTTDEEDADAADLSSSEEEYETLVLGETQEATLERVRRELHAKQAQYDSLLRAMEDAPPAVL